MLCSRFRGEDLVKDGPAPSASPLTDCISMGIEFERWKRRRIEVNFDAGDFSGDGRVLPVRKPEPRSGLLDTVARVLADARDLE